ncbi:dihydrofolate reductase [Myroides odoratus]|uniref:dihydrofolate reductase family protein n=1 Tax=Myroides odoratus TaxID=256 RepID=UPI0033424DF6
MKVALIANISINGRILVSDNPAHQLPQEALAFYLKMVHQVGNLVIGRQTFQNFQNFPQEVKDLFEGIEIVVLSNTTQVIEGYVGVDSPEQAIAYMAQKGINEIAIGGGTGTFNAFITKDLVTDLYLNVSPIITGEGEFLGRNHPFHTAFEIITHKEKQGLLQLHLAKPRN